jgi:hypothetical protein
VVSEDPGASTLTLGFNPGASNEEPEISYGRTQDPEQASPRDTWTPGNDSCLIADWVGNTANRGATLGSAPMTSETTEQITPKISVSDRISIGSSARTGAGHCFLHAGYLLHICIILNQIFCSNFKRTSTNNRHKIYMHTRSRKV